MGFTFGPRYNVHWIGTFGSSDRTLDCSATLRRVQIDNYGVLIRFRTKKSSTNT
jgi:hypothetical protein